MLREGARVAPFAQTRRAGSGTRELASSRLHLRSLNSLQTSRAPLQANPPIANSPASSPGRGPEGTKQALRAAHCVFPQRTRLATARLWRLDAPPMQTRSGVPELAASVPSLGEAVTGHAAEALPSLLEAQRALQFGPLLRRYLPGQEARASGPYPRQGQPTSLPWGSACRYSSPGGHGHTGSPSWRMLQGQDTPE